ncbi:hypothetical protein B0J18DRAFT_290421 [Chaetomium sp. MPI-SDFR-AT-0129]|nr:hypothetical protein B0J18DRAFT_290421 [Chaetomium sp. MPI-SDFR-AT-0129]
MLLIRPVNRANQAQAVLGSSRRQTDQSGGARATRLQVCARLPAVKKPSEPPKGLGWRLVCYFLTFPAFVLHKHMLPHWAINSFEIRGAVVPCIGTQYPRRLRNTEPWRGSGTVPHHVLSEHWISVGILDLGMAPGYERVRGLSHSPPLPVSSLSQSHGVCGYRQTWIC